MMFANFISRRSSGSEQSESRFVDDWFFVLLFSGIFALGMIYHYVVPLNAVLYSDGVAGNDSGQMIWNLWSVNEAIAAGHNPYQTSLLYYPQGANLAHHTLAAGFVPVTLLVKVLARGDERYPIYAVRVVTWLCFTLLFFFSYLVLRELACSRLAAVTVAVAYAFGDFYIKHALHLNLIAGFFIPLVAFLIVRSYRRPASMNVVYLALAASGAVYFTEFALYLYCGASLFILLALVFPEERRGLLAAVRSIGTKRFGLAAAVFILVIAPFLFELWRDQVIKPPASDSSLFSANLAAFFVPDRQHTLLAHVFGSLSSRITSGAAAGEEFIGFTLIVFGLAGLFTARRKLVFCTGITALVFYILSLGPTLKIFGTDTGMLLPYKALMNLAPFDNSRTPVRFVAVATFFLTIPAARCLSWTEQALVARWRNFGALPILLVLALTVTQVYSSIPRQVPFIAPLDLRQRVSGPVFNVPLRAIDGYAALLQTFHRQPIATGYLARDSVARRQRFAQLKEIYDRGGPEFCRRIEEVGFRSIVVTRGDVIEPLELSKCSIPVIDLRSELRSEPDNSVGDRSQQFPRLAFGRSVNFAAAAADEFLWYGWSGAESSGRWTERGSAALEFSLAPIQSSVLRVELAPFLAPPRLASQTVQIKINGQMLASLTLSQAELREYSFPLPAQLLRSENVLTFAMPEAQSPRSLGLSEDARLLGIRVRSIQIDEAPLSKKVVRSL
jgi:hypothetical protein